MRTETLTVIVCSVYLFYVLFANLGLGLEQAGLGLDLERAGLNFVH